MMKHEFEALAGYKVSTADYDNIIEPMYLATNLNKADFVATINRKRFEVKEEVKPLIKVMSIKDHAGHYNTPNGCYRHLVDVEVVKVDIRTGNITVKVVEDSYRLGYSYDFIEDDPTVIIK